MLKFFRDNNQLSIFLISFLALLLWYLDLRAAEEIAPATGSRIAPLGKILITWFAKAPVFYYILCLLLLITISFLLVRMNTRFILTLRRTQLPALFFVLCVAGLTHLTSILLPLVACILYGFALERMFMAHKKPRLAYNFFDAAFLITLGSLFYAPAILFNLIVFYSLFQLRAISWREWMLALLGIAAPLFIYYSLDFLFTGSLEIAILENIGFFQGMYFPWYNLVSYFLLTLLALLVIISSVDIATGLQLKKIIARKVYLIFFGNFILSLFLFFIIENAEAGVLLFASVSLGFLFSHYFALIRFNWFREIFFDLLVLLVLAKKILPFFM